MRSGSVEPRRGGLRWPVPGRGLAGALVALMILSACSQASGGPASKAAAPGSAPAAKSAAPVVLKYWSYWADAEGNKAVVAEAARRYEAAHPGSTVEITWYQKSDLWPALRAAFQSGTAPDVFSFDAEVVEFMEGGLLADLSTGITWDNVEPWAKDFWTRKGPAGKDGTWALPIEVNTQELYYNKKMFADLGIQPPGADKKFQWTQDEFFAAVQKCIGAGKDAFAIGTGDRKYPGTYVTNALLLRKLGGDDLDDLWTGRRGGKITWNDPRVQDALQLSKRLVEMKAYPSSISSLKLGEAHRYFHTEEKACMMPVASFYPSRAFQTPDQGGQPADFQVGMMNYPSLEGDGGNTQKPKAMGGAVAVWAKTKNQEQAIALVNAFADPEMGSFWMQKVGNATGIKTDPSKLGGEREWYFKMYQDVNAAASSLVLDWQTMMQPEMNDAYAQILNGAFPAGLISVADATTKLEAVRAKAR